MGTEEVGRQGRAETTQEASALAEDLSASDVRELAEGSYDLAQRLSLNTVAGRKLDLLRLTDFIARTIGRCLINRAV